MAAVFAIVDRLLVRSRKRSHKNTQVEIIHSRTHGTHTANIQNMTWDCKESVFFKCGKSRVDIFDGGAHARTLVRNTNYIRGDAGKKSSNDGLLHVVNVFMRKYSNEMLSLCVCLIKYKHAHTHKPEMG